MLFNSQPLAPTVPAPVAMYDRCTLEEHILFAQEDPLVARCSRRVLHLLAYAAWTGGAETTVLDHDAVLRSLGHASTMLTRQISDLRHLITQTGRPRRARRCTPVAGTGAPDGGPHRLDVDTDVRLRYSDGLVPTRLLPEVEEAVYRVVREAADQRLPARAGDSSARVGGLGPRPTADPRAERHHPREGESGANDPVGIA